MKTLVVVSGGDAPGINATIASFVKSATDAGNSVVGADGGFPTVLAGDMEPITLHRILPFAAQAGGIIASSREPVLGQSGAEEKLKAVLAREGIDNIMMFGGDGSLRHIPPLLESWGIPCIGIPTTIDNDVPGTERTLGFDSACNFAYPLVDGALATARALPGRIFLIETLGGHTGFLALQIAQGAGAHAVLIPEIDFKMDWLAGRINATIERDGHCLIVLCEGIPGINTLASDITEATGIRTRWTRLGHAQRGGIPTHIDRVLGADMGRMAHRALSDGVKMGMVFMRQNQLMIHEGTPSDFPTPEPSRAQYNRVNGLV